MYVLTQTRLKITADGLEASTC